MGKVGLCTPTESRIESGMSSHYWMCKANKRSVCARVERTKQVERERDPLSAWAHTSKKPSKVEKKHPYKYSLQDAGLVNLYEDLATGHDSPRLNWRCLNRLRTGYTCSKEQRKKWGYFNGDTTCECGLAAERTSHMLQRSLLAHPCTLDDLLEFNDTAQACTERWKKIV